MNKISWSEIQSIFPTESAAHNKEFSDLFSKLGKQELTIEDIDSVLKTPKQASFTRMIYDSIGQVIGRIDTDDSGDGRCYNQIGNYMGSTFGGMTLNANGEIVAQSDVLSSLLFREERMIASIGLNDLIKQAGLPDDEINYGDEVQSRDAEPGTVIQVNPKGEVLVQWQDGTIQGYNYNWVLKRLLKPRKATQTDPFTGLSLDRKLTDEELARAIRLDLEAELDAINLYSSHLEATDHEEAKKVLEHVIKEEKDHHALFTGLINKLDPEQTEIKGDDYLEEVKEGSTKQAGGLDDFIIKWDESRAFRVEALEHAELKTDLTSNLKWEDLEKHVQRYIYSKWIGLYASVKKISRVVHRSDGWHVLSEKGKNLGGPYKTKAQAVTRLRQVEYFKHKGSMPKVAGTELWQTADGKWWLLSTLTMTQVGPFFDDKFKVVEYAVNKMIWTPDAGKRVFDSPQPDGVGDPDMLSSNIQSSITLAHLVEAIGIDYTELEERAEDYVPVTQSRGKFKLYEVVNTPFGRGRIITRQTESKPYSYGVRITDTDEVEIVEEQEIKRIRRRSVTLNRETQESYSLDSILGSDEKEDEKPIGLKDILKEHEKVSISKISALKDIHWLKRLWEAQSKKIMHELSGISPEFMEKYTDGHIPLWEVYSKDNLKTVTEPFMTGSISRDQAEKLLRDLLWQFQAALYQENGLTIEEARKDKEKEEVKESSQEDLPAYGSSDVWPPKGTGAGMPSSSDLSRIVNEIPTRNVQVI